MNVAGHNKNLKERLTNFVANWAPFVCIKLKNNTWCYQHLQTEGWRDITEAELPATTMFSKVVLLMPTEECSFKTCYFPQHMVAENELQEAIELDIKQWSIWEEYSYFFTHQLLDDQWQVKIWLWSPKIFLKYALPLKTITHIIPEPAWYAACLAGDQSSLLIHTNERQTCYALVTATGWIEKTAQIQPHQKAQQERQYWHSWGLVPIEHCWITTDKTELWHPDSVLPQTIDKKAVPHTQLLKKTRLPNVKDWADPTSYRTFFGVILLGLAVWMVADATLLHYQKNQVQEVLKVARESANDVLKLRKQVTERQKSFTQVLALRYKQQLPEHLIAQLTQKIPNDIWLTRLQLEDDQLDITGKGLQVARLLPLLEQIEGIEEVMLLSAITPNAKTKEESFQIRLILTQMQ